MFKVLVPAVALLALATVAARSHEAARMADDDAMPVMGWSVHHEGALAKLTYGVANSDQLALMIACMPGDRTAEFYGDVQIEGVRLTHVGLDIDPLSGGDADQTRILVDDPALARLAREGRMTVIGDAGRFSLAADVKDRRLVGDFLAYCSPGWA